MYKRLKRESQPIEIRNHKNHVEMLNNFRAKKGKPPLNQPESRSSSPYIFSTRPAARKPREQVLSTSSKHFT